MSEEICLCGAKHIMQTQYAIVGKDINIKEIVKKFLPTGQLAIINVGYQEISDGIADKLSKEFKIKKISFSSDIENKIDIAKDIIISDDIRLAIVISSGNISPIKLKLTEINIPYISIAMSEFVAILSNYHRFIADRKVQLIKVNPPVAIICDMNFIEKTEDFMLVSTYGEIFAKYVCVLDNTFLNKIGEKKVCKYALRKLENILDGFFNLEFNDSYIKSLADCAIKLGLELQKLDDYCDTISTISDYMEIIADDGRRGGENQFIVALVVLSWYKGLLLLKSKDTLIPIDRLEKVDKLAKLCGLERHLLANEIVNVKSDLVMKSQYIINECNDEFIEFIEKVLFNKKNLVKISKKLYNDFGYSNIDFTTTAEIFSIIKNVSAVMDKYSLLTHFSSIGYL